MPGLIPRWKRSWRLHEIPWGLTEPILRYTSRSRNMSLCIVMSSRCRLSVVQAKDLSSYFQSLHDSDLLTSMMTRTTISIIRVRRATGEWAEGSTVYRSEEVWQIQ